MQVAALTGGGACITDGVGDYGNSEYCVIRTTAAVSISSTGAFSTRTGDSLRIYGLNPPAGSTHSTFYGATGPASANERLRWYAM